MKPNKPSTPNHVTIATQVTGAVTSTLAALYALPAGAGIVHHDTPLTTVTTHTGGYADVQWDVDGAFGADFVITDIGFTSIAFLDSIGLNGQGMVQLHRNGIMMLTGYPIWVSGIGLKYNPV